MPIVERPSRAAQEPAPTGRQAVPAPSLPLPEPRSARAGGADGLAQLVSFARIAAALAALALLAVHLGNRFVWSYDWRLDANQEESIWTWASVVATGVLAFGALLGGFVASRGRARWFSLAAIALFLSLDDSMSIHEKLIGKVVALGGIPVEWDSALWPAFYLPLMAFAVVCMHRVVRDGEADVVDAFRLGVGLLVFAVAAEVVSAPWSEGANLVHNVEGGFEEAAELAGWMLIAVSIAVQGVRGLLGPAPAEPPVRGRRSRFMRGRDVVAERV